MGKKVALTHLLKMGGTRNTKHLKISKSICNYLVSHQIKITADYLPIMLNVRADWAFKNAADTFYWKFHQFVSRLCHQLAQ